MPDGDRALHQENIYYLQGILDNVNNGWRPPTSQGGATFDAIGVASAGDASFGLGVNAGVELVYNLQTGDITLFAVLGGSITAGGDMSGNINGVLIYNIDDDNLNYMGPFTIYEGGVAALGGGSIGYGRTLGDGSLCSEPCSVYAGIKGGAAFYGSVGRVEYIPLATIDGESGETIYHANDYLHGDLAPSVNDINQWLSPTGPYRRLFEALETQIEALHQ